MSKRAIIILTASLLLLGSPVLLRKYTVPLVSNGKVVAVARRPLVMPWMDSAYAVYAGKTKLFSLWGDFFEGPLFIYPFADGQRFLCIHDFDVEVLVFVVDCGGSATNLQYPPQWPPNDYTRRCLAEGATNVVIETKGLVRLPSYAEVQEVSRSLVDLTPRRLNAASFPCWNLGVCRCYLPKEFLLRQLDTNRQSVWPLK
jgi:hypothetical protein